MKTQTFYKVRAAIKNMLAPAAFACLLMASTIPAFASGEKKAEMATPVDVKYIGKVDNHPIFQVEVDNLLQEDMYVTLRDEQGSVLYGEKFNAKKFCKKFQFSSDEGADLNVTISLSSSSGNYKNARVFEISNVTKVVQDVVVTKIR